MGCSGSTTFLKGQPPKISEIYKISCDGPDMLTVGSLTDLTDTLVINTQRLNDCKIKDDKLIRQVREIEEYYK